MKKTMVLMAGLAAIISTNSYAEHVQSIGWIEHVQVASAQAGGNLKMQAKIDTGADNSSLHAENIQIHDEDGTQMVRFTVTNKDGDTATFNLPLVRVAEIRVKRAGAAPLERPVVNMNLCIGDMQKTVPVNLADRANFKYRMLIGRSYLKDRYLVNSGLQYTAEPACDGNVIAHNDS
jgi:hypothetical protein